jgi:hypothetical protein
MRSLSHEPIRGNVRLRDQTRPYVVFRRDDLTPAEAGRERARLTGRAYVAVRVKGDGENGMPGAIVYFDAATAQPSLSRPALDAIGSAFADAVPRDPIDDEPLVCGTGTNCYAFMPYSELVAHRLARQLVDIGRRDQQRTMSRSARA